MRIEQLMSSTPNAKDNEDTILARIEHALKEQKDKLEQQQKEKLESLKMKMTQIETSMIEKDQELLKQEEQMFNLTEEVSSLKTKIEDCEADLDTKVQTIKEMQLESQDMQEQYEQNK